MKYFVDRNTPFWNLFTKNNCNRPVEYKKREKNRKKQVPNVRQTSRKKVIKLSCGLKFIKMRKITHDRRIHLDDTTIHGDRLMFLKKKLIEERKKNNRELDGIFLWFLWGQFDENSTVFFSANNRKFLSVFDIKNLNSLKAQVAKKC